MTETEKLIESIRFGFDRLNEIFRTDIQLIDAIYPDDTGLRILWHTSYRDMNGNRQHVNYDKVLTWDEFLSNDAYTWVERQEEEHRRVEREKRAAELARYAAQKEAMERAQYEKLKEKYGP